MKSERISFTNTNGEKLAARLEKPLDMQPWAYAVFAHCFTCSKNLLAVKNISRALTQEGIAVLRFDFTGLGESEGDFADTNFTSNVEDLVQAAEYLSSHYQAPSILIGHSLGGAAVLMAASQLDTIQAVATIGAPYSPAHVSHIFQDKLDEIKQAGEATVSIGGRSFRLKKQFVEDLEEKHMEDVVTNLHKPLLILHSPIDNTVGIDNAATIYQKAHHPKSFISLDQADHLLSRKADSLYAGNVIASWAQRYLDKPEEPTLETDQQVVTRTGAEGYTTEIRSGNHHLLADEPESAGGEDLGPSPYDYLLSGLGACTGMTLRMYADRKEWPLEEVRVHLKHGKGYADDCDNCEEKKGNKVDRIERIVEVEGDLTEEQKQKLLEIADKCPVHRTLHSEIDVRTSIK